MARATMLQPIWAYFFTKKYAVEILHTRAEFSADSDLFLPKSMLLSVLYTGAEFYSQLGPILLPKSMQLNFHILELNLTANLGLFLPKSMQLSFHILELNFTANLGLYLPKSMLLRVSHTIAECSSQHGPIIYQKVCS